MVFFAVVIARHGGLKTALEREVAPEPTAIQGLSQAIGLGGAVCASALWVGFSTQKISDAALATLVSAYRSLHQVRVYGAEEELSGEDVLPGFSLKVAEIFA